MIDEILSHQLSASQQTFLRKSIQGITIAAILLVSPFAIYNLIQGYFLLGFSAVAILIAVSCTAWRTLQGHLSYKISFVVVMPALLFFFWVSIKEQQIIGVLWSFPALIMFYFILPERLARFANFAFLCVVIPQSFVVFDHDIALRIMATQVSVSIFCMIFVRRLNSQQLELEDLASTDPLTRLANRMNLDRTLDQAIEGSHNSGRALSILSLDLDDFKNINNQFGRKAGDRVLESFSGLLVDVTRNTDEIFRLGGEEFLILLRDTGRETALRVAEKIHAALADNQSENGLLMTASIGVATLSAGEDRYDLLQQGDQKLYRAKTDGKNCTRS